ncbi:glycoside hydrolase family 75 protein [Streptomyces aurantiacus]|uniref:Secreted protein n=1 Tax=Streptomyces aurantiacus TaxID=47760 RepID=A0A7G1NUG8_9ACTN|nr:glycoside hydrolase family 75 protein [Streptomyces aurantiacus]BCL26499.1 hypothetical protein GCM10017557_13580 [Streptomyces aurantiacus]
MRARTLILAAAGGAALLAAAVLPAGAAAPAPARNGPVGAAALLAEVTHCSRISNGRYRTDVGTPATVPVCGKDGAVFWKADMDIDCDGQVTARCNRRADPSFLEQTAFRQSDGRPLNSEKLPHIVVPAPGTVWNHTKSGVRGGSVAAVIHGGRIQYAVVGDIGPSAVIGEASYATARGLGIDPDPKSGGTGSGVTYIVFTDSEVTPIESPGAAASLGEKLARRFLARN